MVASRVAGGIKWPASAYRYGIRVEDNLEELYPGLMSARRAMVVLYPYQLPANPPIQGQISIYLVAVIFGL